MSGKTDGGGPEAYERAFGYERDYGNCAQATLKALLDLYGEQNETAYRGMGSFAGGGAAEGDGSCGAYVGGLFYIGMKCGRRFSDIGSDPEDSTASKISGKNQELARMLHEKFIEKYGTVVCHQIQRKLFGRVYYTPDEQQYGKFLEAGGHDSACPSVCGDAARWTVEILKGA
ncbi:MAG TPA: C-GCAxxG-C-C family protein [Spirochaetota bacterium]|nr:C-GCAxxG-C-C family protein [Spirochaetota bacterium]